MADQRLQHKREISELDHEVELLRQVSGRQRVAGASGQRDSGDTESRWEADGLA
jgi:hypothetical protein